MFLDKMKDELLNSDGNKKLTENGAIGYESTKSELLNLNFKVPSLRDCSDEEISNSFSKAYLEDKQLFLKWMFFLRDCRGGLGEKSSFKRFFKELVKHDADCAISLIKLIPEYGSWKDVLDLFFYYYDNTENDDNILIHNNILELITKQINEDIIIVESGEDKPISLLGKWLPSINAGKESRQKALKLVNLLNKTNGAYRQLLSKLRKHIDVVERKMCAKEFDKINYSTVPSVAHLLYRESFKRNDGERYEKYLYDVLNGKVKINASVLFPHNIYAKYNNKKSKDNSIEALWCGLPNNVDDNSTIVVCDGSYSMLTEVSSGVEAIDISRALSIYFSEKLTGPYKDKVIEFSSKPKLIEFDNCDSLYDKYKLISSYHDCSNTNIEAVFDLILNTAVKNNLKQNDIPKNVLIVSDMEFDYALTPNPSESLFETIGNKFKAHGLLMPKLIFWNVNSRTNTIPCLENEYGVALVSGYSTNICNMICSGEVDPYKAMLSVLNSDRYKAIENVLN